MSEEATQRRLAREASETFLGTLGDRDGANVAKVEVSWWYEDPGLGAPTEHAGHYLVRASGDEPEAQGEEGTIYAVFENLVNAAMHERQAKLGFSGYSIDDTYAA